MSHFIAIAVLPIRRRPRSLVEVSGLFSGEFEVESLAISPLGRVTAGRADRIVFALTVGGTSSDLFGNGRRREPLVRAAKRAINDLFFTYGGLAVLVHFARGRLEREEVVLRDTQRVSLTQFTGLFPEQEEDVRYVITHPGG